METTIKDIKKDIQTKPDDEKTKKQKLGQFYTTNYKQILDGLSIPDNVNYIIEPFAGSGDLLKFLTDDNERYGDIAVEC